MRIQTFSFTGGGWSSEPDGAFDSDRTLVVLIGASSLIDQPAPVRRVIDAYPRSRIMGCSSSGEIHGTRVLDDSLAVAVAKVDPAGRRRSPRSAQHTGPCAGCSDA